MESLRLISLVVLCVSLFLLGEKWVARQNANRPAEVASQAALPASKPSPVASVEGVPGPQGLAVPSPEPAATADADSVVVLESDVLRLEIGLRGGEVRRALLPRHGDTLDAKKPFALLEVAGTRTYVAQSGLIGKGLPDHKVLYSADQSAARLQDGQESVTLELVTKGGPEGRVVRKRYTLHRGTYVLDVSVQVEGLNDGEANAAASYFQLVRDETPPAGDSRWVPTYTGVALYTDKDKYQKIAFSDIAKGKAKMPTSLQDGWIGIVQHYFVGAWLPDAGKPREFFVRALDKGLFSAGTILPLQKVEGDKWGAHMRLYLGPQEQDNLKKLADGLQLTVDYGWLTVIATPLFIALSSIHQWVAPNWGVAIIILTVLIKLLFFPLSAASYRSMAKMRVMAPRLQRLKEQFGDDRQKLHQAMMELYKTEKINPLGGCLPIVIQIPVFIALYWVLLGSVEMRQAPFVLWISDLSSSDPFYVLPVLMGISMVIQSRLNPEPPDPIQAKVMKVMPIAFSIFFFFFPAGLVLYWLVNNILSIAQQWFITRKLESAGVAAPKR